MVNLFTYGPIHTGRCSFGGRVKLLSPMTVYQPLTRVFVSTLTVAWRSFRTPKLNDAKSWVDLRTCGLFAHARPKAEVSRSSGE